MKENKPDEKTPKGKFFGISAKELPDNLNTDDDDGNIEQISLTDDLPVPEEEPDTEEEIASEDESDEDESADEDSADEGESENKSDFADYEIMVELPYDVEFHSDIVEKSERQNAEDHIKLVSDKVEDTDEPVYEDVFKPEEEEAKSPTPIAEYSLYDNFDPEQIAMSFDDAKSETKRDFTVYDEKRPRIVDHIFDAIEILTVTLAAAIIITTIFFRFSFVDGHSMDLTLAHGDTLLISNLFYTPEYGDVVVFEYENEIGEKRPLVKRIIGLEGDEIQVTKNGLVYRNGELLDEEYIYVDGPIPLSLSGTWKVREGEVFVMGDHRNDSKDSREIGPVKVNSILGRAVLRLFPIQTFGAID